MASYSTLKVGRWNLTDLVKDPSADEFSRFLDSIESQIKEFEANRTRLWQDIPATEFEQMIHALESISEKISIASGYAHLDYYSDTSSNKASALVTKMEKMAADAGNRLLFFDLWFKKGLDDVNADRLIEAMPKVYREYLRHKRLVAKYSLSEPEEKIINTLEVTGTRALVKIYDKMSSGFEFEMKLRKGKKTIVRRFDNREKLVHL